MKRLYVVLALGTLAAAASSPTRLLAQESKTARGTVIALAADVVTVKVGDHEMKFAVDGKTSVEAIGAGTKAKQAQVAGQPGPKLTDVIKVGQAVTVSYHDMGGTLHAARIRAVPSVGASGGGMASDTKTSMGTVKSIAATSLTIEGSSGAGATFSQSFTIDGTTKVIGRGAGTAAAAAGGKAVVTDLVGTGDKVSVAYHAAGNTLHAAEIRVTGKATAAK